jgi:hypothetical protein
LGISFIFDIFLAVSAVRTLGLVGIPADGIIASASGTAAVSFCTAGAAEAVANARVLWYVPAAVDAAAVNGKLLFVHYGHYKQDMLLLSLLPVSELLKLRPVRKGHPGSADNSLDFL